MLLMLMIMPATLAAIILLAVYSYAKRTRAEARVCGDVRQVLARIKPLVDPGTFEPDAPPAAQPGSMA